MQYLESSDHRAMSLTYEAGQGPIDISVVDPVKIPKGTFILKFEDPTLTNTRCNYFLQKMGLN